MRKTITSAAVAALLCVSLPSAWASDEAAVEFRESAMNIYRWYVKPMGGMAKGEIPFDAAAFQANAEGLATAARLDIAPGFPEGSDFDTEAKPEIWENWPEFLEKFKALQDESAKLAEAAAGGDEAAMKAQFREAAKTCSDCHKRFRER